MTSSHWSYFTSQINLHNSAEILRVLIVPVKTSEDSHLPGAVDAADWGYSRGSQQPGGLGPSEGQEGSLPGTGKVLLRGQTRSLQGHEAPLPAPARQLATSVCLSISVPCNLHPNPFPLLLQGSSEKVLPPELGDPAPCASCAIVSGPRWHSRSAAAPPRDKPSRPISLSCVPCMMCSLRTPWVQQRDRQRREER